MIPPLHKEILESWLQENNAEGFMSQARGCICGLPNIGENINDWEGMIHPPQFELECLNCYFWTCKAEYRITPNNDFKKIQPLGIHSFEIPRQFNDEVRLRKIPGKKTMREILKEVQ